MKKNILFIILCYFSFTFCFAQLTVTTGQTLQWLVENVLDGEGVFLSNVTYTGHPNAIGRFQTGSNPTNLGINEGIIISSGNVFGSPPIGSPVYGFVSTDNFLPGDVLLNNLISGVTKDAAILEMDCLPLGDTLMVKFVFGSEEYNEYVGTSYSDVFGFFISGPLPVSGSYTNYNIATIPGTSVPVAVNTINAGANSQFYINNENINGQTIVFDGFTTVLTAWVVVVPYMNYHLKIAIADGDDGVFDSAVFLEAGSLKTNSNCDELAAVSSNSPLCIGDTLFLSASGGTDYIWNGPNGFYSTEQNPVLPDFSQVNEGIYQVEIQCSDWYSITLDVETELSVVENTEICFVDVDSYEQKNKIFWKIPLPDNVISVLIYKETAPDVWTYIASSDTTQFFYLDTTSNSQDTSSSYKIRVLDKCEHISELSLPHTSLCLKADYDQEENIYFFEWNSYMGIDVENYLIYGIRQPFNQSVLIGSVSGNVNDYSYFNPFQEYLKYYVAFETLNCNTGQMSLVKSNIVNSVFNSLTEFSDTEFQVFPNPANEAFEISTDFVDFNIKILDISGRILMELSNDKVVDVSMLLQGTYIIVFSNREYSGFRKFVKF